VLTPITSGKVLALGRVWTGELRPKIDAFVARVEPLTRGFAAGHIVGPEAASATLNIGTPAQDLEREIMSAALPTGADGPTDVDVTELYAEVRAFRRSVGSAPDEGDASEFEDRLRGIVRAADAVTAQVRRARTGDAHGHPMIRGWSRPIGNGSRPVSPQTRNENNKAFWDKRTTVQPRVRDNFHAPAPLPRTLVGGSSTPRTPAEINEANKRYWAGR
jgi:hypothetical protein